jgi:hypothetical protein
VKRKDSNTKQSPLDAAQRLAELLRTKGVIPYHVDMPDKEFPYVKGSIYGAPKTNELFVKLTNGKVTFVEAIESGLLHPAMADRIFGMDVMDWNDAIALAERMWEKHKKDLVLGSDQQRQNGRKK